MEENEKIRRIIEQYMVLKLAQTRIPLGKTKFQKLMYLLTAKRIVDIPDYQLYHFGPYSSMINFDLMYLNHIGAITIEWVDYGSGYYGYKISPKNNVRNNDIANLGQVIDVVDKIIDNFGKLNTKELSILATAVYLSKRAANKDKETLIDKVYKLKPNYSKSEIEEVLDKYLGKYFSI